MRTMLNSINGPKSQKKNKKLRKINKKKCSSLMVKVIMMTMRPQRFQAKKVRTVSKLMVLIRPMTGYSFAWVSPLMDKRRDKFG